MGIGLITLANVIIANLLNLSDLYFFILQGVSGFIFFWFISRPSIYEFFR